MIGSNSTALRQHAYSVFTASRRANESGEDIPESVLRHMAANPPQPVPISTPPGRADRSTEAKPLPSDRAANVTRGCMLGTVAPSTRLAKQSSAAFTELIKPEAGEPSKDEIRRRAHKIFEARHGAWGDPVADWLRAEAELRRERGLA